MNLNLIGMKAQNAKSEPSEKNRSLRCCLQSTRFNQATIAVKNAKAISV